MNIKAFGLNQLHFEILGKWPNLLAELYDPELTRTNNTKEKYGILENK